MLLKLLLMFTVIPLVELWLLIEVGRIIGSFITIILVASTGFFGVLLARSQGLQIFYRMQEEMRGGFVPTDEILDGVCILVGGAVLLTPGLITDLVGFLLLIPVSRELIKKTGKKIIEK
ncbi:MAG: FxsA family protein, partial [Bacillota bacterium]|nr:FxsA family protein [Bacillota bacterium]